MTPPPRMKTGKSSVYDPKSGVQLIGVRKGRKGRYEAVMRGPKRSVILLGSFDTPEEAARAYDEEARELRGPKAKTNFPPVEKKYDDDGDDDDTKKGFGTSTSSSPVDVDLQHSDWDFFLSQEDAQLIAEPDDSQKKSTDWSSFMQYLECAQRETELTVQARLIIDSDVIDYDAGARELRGPKAKTNFPQVEKKDDDDDDDTKKGFGTSTSSNPVDVDLQHTDWDFFLSQEDAQLIAEPDDSQKKSTDWSSFMRYLECAQRETELTAQARLITDSDVIDYDAGARELRGPKAKTSFPPVEKKDDDDDDTKKGFGSSTSSRPVDVDLQHSDWDLFLSHLEQEDAQQIGGPDGLQKKNKDWNLFMQYLECAQPETELSALARSITDSDVIDYLGHLIKLRERKVHVRTCPFSHFPSAICTCQANEALEESLYTIAFRLEVAFHDLYNQLHHSNPFASLTVRDYLRVYERGTAEAGGSHGGGGCGAVYSGSTSSATTASIEMKLHQLNLGEIGPKRKLDGLSEDNNMVKQRAGLASRRDQTTSSSKRTGFGLNKLLFGITKKGRSKYAGPKEELMVLDEMGSKSELVQTVDKWTKGRFGDENITGTSPEEGRFGDKLQEAHSILGIEDDLMSFMGSKPFCLQILDLSGTTISSLPKCISELVTLESLTLRDCRLLMELPPEIAELTNLEVLDLLGTEVVCLPKEIAKLVNLRSFRIALCGYADHFKESRGIDYVIPRNALSKLSGLSDLRIHVNPDGDWWDVEVKAVIEDLRDLGNLRTLHLDLPKVDLLDDLIRSITQLLHLSSLRFRLTVGPHEERIIHRLPKHVEKEFRDLERFEKGVKYTNSEGIPVEIKNALKYVDAFLLERHWSVNNLLEFGVENMNELKCCILLECNELQTVIDAEECEDFYRSILGSLECLSIHYMKKMERIWRGPVMKGSLSNMKSLALHTCLSLTTVFTLDLLSNLMNLEELIIEDCPKIKTLVSSNSPNLIPQNFLPKLKTMLLLELPNLGSVSSGVTIAPKLERLVIFYCPKLDKLSPVEISSRDLKVIKGEKRWWDALKWYESSMTEEEQEYMAGKFVPLRKDEDLEEQFMRD